jgi:hypothetical protein
MELVSKVLLAIEVGPRLLAMAQRVVHQGAQRFAPTCAPVLERRLHRLPARPCGPLWLLGAPGAPSSHRPVAQAALDAIA